MAVTYNNVYGVSEYWQLDFFQQFVQTRSDPTKLRISGLLWGEFTGNLTKGLVMRITFPCKDAIIRPIRTIAVWQLVQLSQTCFRIFMHDV